MTESDREFIRLFFVGLTIVMFYSIAGLFILLTVLYVRYEEKRYYRLNLVKIKDSDIIALALVSETEKNMMAVFLENIGNKSLPPYDQPSYIILQYDVSTKKLDGFQIIKTIAKPPQGSITSYPILQTFFNDKI